MSRQSKNRTEQERAFLAAVRDLALVAKVQQDLAGGLS